MSFSDGAVSGAPSGGWLFAQTRDGRRVFLLRSRQNGMRTLAEVRSRRRRCGRPRCAHPKQQGPHAAKPHTAFHSGCGREARPNVAEVMLPERPSLGPEPLARRIGRKQWEVPRVTGCLRAPHRSPRSGVPGAKPTPPEGPAVGPGVIPSSTL